MPEHRVNSTGIAMPTSRTWNIFLLVSQNIIESPTQKFPTLRRNTHDQMLFLLAVKLPAFRLSALKPNYLFPTLRRNTHEQMICLIAVQLPAFSLSALKPKYVCRHKIFQPWGETHTTKCYFYLQSVKLPAFSLSTLKPNYFCVHKSF